MISLRPFCLFLLLIGCTLPALAQTSDDAQSDEEPLLRGSNSALVFALDELRLGSLNGGIGMRWFIGQRSALRATLRLSVESIEDVTEGRSDTGRSAFGVGGNFLVEWHTHEFRRVSPYMAAGAGVGFDAFSETTDFTPDSPLQRQRTKGTLVDFIVKAGFGVEVYFTKSVSLSGEHLFTATVQSLSGTETNTLLNAPQTVFDRSGTSFIFGTGTSNLILSVFF